jgi:hypothetical protein
MQVIAIDPGLTIGLASVEVFGGTLSIDVHQTADVLEAENWIERHMCWDPVILVEEYVGSGHLTKEAKHTVEVLGFFKYLFNGHPMNFPVPQARKAHVSEAQHFITELGVTEGPHNADALAHALAYLRKNNVSYSAFV